MKRCKYYIGLDIAAEHVTATIMTSPEQPVQTKERIANSAEGFDTLLSWLKERRIHPQGAVICMEATGVYVEHLCYFLHAQGYRIAVEPPTKVKRAFDQAGHKNDTVDSTQIAEYAYRYFDELSIWRPNSQSLEQIRVLLSAREQFTQQLVANTNALKTIQRKYVQTPLADQRYQQTIDQLKDNIKAINREIKKLIDSDSSFRQMVSHLTSIPGVGMLLASHLLVLTHGFTTVVSARQLAAHVGICPYEHTSGSSLYRKPPSRRYGPPTLRKLLYLAAMSLRTHQPAFRRYFLRKVAEGKPARLVINNIANKLLKIVCAIIRTQSVFIPNYQSVHPQLLTTS